MNLHLATGAAAILAGLVVACGGKTTGEGSADAGAQPSRDDSCLPAPGGGHLAGSGCPDREPPIGAPTEPPPPPPPPVVDAGDPDGAESDGGADADGGG